MSHNFEPVEPKKLKLLETAYFSVPFNVISLNFFENLTKQKIGGRPFMNSVYVSPLTMYMYKQNIPFWSSKWKEKNTENAWPPKNGHGGLEIDFSGEEKNMAETE